MALYMIQLTRTINDFRIVASILRILLCSMLAYMLGAIPKIAIYRRSAYRLWCEVRFVLHRFQLHVTHWHAVLSVLTVYLRD